MDAVRCICHLRAAGKFPLLKESSIAILKGHCPRRNNEILLTEFPRHIAKCHQIYNKIGYKDYIEQNRSGSSERNCRITRIEVDYSSSIFIS